MRSAIQVWTHKRGGGGAVVGDCDVERILEGVRSRYALGRFRREGKQFRGFVGVCIRPECADGGK